MAGMRMNALPWDINHVIAYGQSLSTGWDGWPVLSTEAQLDCLMLGASLRPAEEAAPRFVPVGGRRFCPLAATAQEIGTGRLLAPGTRPTGPCLGETVVESALAFWRLRQLEEGAGPGRLLGSACGVGGRSLAQLSTGAAPELFHRLRDCVRQAREAARAEGRSYGLAAVLLLQGETDVAGGGTNERAAYKALLLRLIDDIRGELAGGQTPSPRVVLYQTTGAYAHDAMGVPQAQLEAALERPGVALAAPCYPYPEAGGHLDGNGYRWLGAQFGKVLHRVLTRGEPWQPLHPLAATLEGRTVRLRFQVPRPPLTFGWPFRGIHRCEIADRGFTVADATGSPVPLAVAALDGPASVRLELARPPGPGPLRVRYADLTRHAGRGCLHDSDPTVADATFAADFAGCRYAAEDAFALHGRAYPLVNWCVGFTLPVSGT
jgi:hypothetical protein